MRPCWRSAAWLAALCSLSCSPPDGPARGGQTQPGATVQRPADQRPADDAPPPPATRAPVELEIERISLTGPAADRRAEWSGLAWAGDHLLLLPQFPERFDGPANGVLFAIPRARLRAWVAGDRQQPIAPQAIPLQAPGLLQRIPGWQGFEAIACAGDRVYLTIEAGIDGQMTGYLITGTLAPDLSSLTLELITLTKIRSQAGVANAAEEALLLTGDRVMTVYEANGANINPTPRVHVFDRGLRRLPEIAFPTIEYRVTDATEVDEHGHFWVYNGFYPGDRQLLQPAPDAIAATYGEGPTQVHSDIVERLLPMRIGDDGIHLRERPPIQFRVGEKSRNWEGLARLDERTFLLASDFFPETIFGYVVIPE